MSRATADMQRKPSPRAGRSFRAATAWTLILATLALAAAAFVPALVGYERYVITSGSMTGSLDRGSLVYAKAVPVSELEVGDVITYEPPPESGKSGLVTHRIVAIDRNAGGPTAFRTKGDANRTPDPWRFVLRRPTQARVDFDVPYLGYPFAALAERKLRMLVIGIPALLVALAVLVDLWREAGTGAADRRSPELAGAAPPTPGPDAGTA